MNRVILSLIASLLVLASCVKVEEEPVTIEAGQPQAILLQVNGCDWDHGVRASYYNIEIPITNLDKIFIEKVTVDEEGYDEPFEYSDFTLSNNLISYNDCFRFGNLESKRLDMIITATNKVGEKLSNKKLTLTLERPFGAE